MVRTASSSSLSISRTMFCQSVNNEYLQVVSDPLCSKTARFGRVTVQLQKYPADAFFVTTTQGILVITDKMREEQVTDD